MPDIKETKLSAPFFSFHNQKNLICGQGNNTSSMHTISCITGHIFLFKKKNLPIYWVILLDWTIVTRQSMHIVSFYHICSSVDTLLSTEVCYNTHNIVTKLWQRIFSEQVYPYICFPIENNYLAKPLKMQMQSSYSQTRVRLIFSKKSWMHIIYFPSNILSTI